MFPFSYTGLRLVHDEKVRDAMERAHIDAELSRSSRRAVRLSLLRNVLKSIHSRLSRAGTCCQQAPSSNGVFARLTSGRLLTILRRRYAMIVHMAS